MLSKKDKEVPFNPQNISDRLEEDAGVRVNGQDAPGAERKRLGDVRELVKKAKEAKG